MREVVITGLGVVLPQCDTPARLWGLLKEGESQLQAAVPAGCADPLPAGMIDDFDPDRHLERFPRRYRARWSREIQLYLAALCGALDDAGVDPSELGSDRVGLFDGVARPAFRFWYERRHRPQGSTDLVSGTPGQAVGTAASLFGIRGPTYSFTNTCASGAVAVGQAWMHIRSGMVDMALAGGHESSLCAPLYAMYESADLISRIEDPKRAVAPWSGHSGNAFGEGAVVLVLEEKNHALRAGRRPLAELRGFAFGNSGHHPTSVEAQGSRPAALIEEVLESGGVPRDELSFVVGHGNGVRQSDISEQNYMRRVFGRRSAEVPLISIKPIFGHLLGASSALNVVAAAQMVQHRFVVPTLNATPLDTAADVFHMPHTGRPAPCDHGIAVSYGLGGHNAVVLVSRAPEAE